VRRLEIRKTENIDLCLSVADRVKVEYDAVDRHVGEGESWYSADLLVRRVKSGEAGTLCVSQVLDDELRDGADAAVTADIAARRADASRHFRSGLVSRRLVDWAQRRSGTCRALSGPLSLSCTVRRQND